MVDRKNFLRNWIMKIGENSVGKSLLFGTYDPLIPDELKREVQKQKRKAELKALQAQINPHFLYNTYLTS